MEPGSFVLRFLIDDLDGELPLLLAAGVLDPGDKAPPRLCFLYYIPGLASGLTASLSSNFKELVYLYS